MKVYGQLENAQLEIMTAAEEAGATMYEGRVWYNSTTNVVKAYVNGAKRSITDNRLSGAAADAINLGSFIHGIIPANSSIKVALQTIETGTPTLKYVVANTERSTTTDITPVVGLPLGGIDVVGASVSVYTKSGFVRIALSTEQLITPSGGGNACIAAIGDSSNNYLGISLSHATTSYTKQNTEGVYYFGSAGLKTIKVRFGKNAFAGGTAYIRNVCLAITGL